MVTLVVCQINAVMMTTLGHKAPHAQLLMQVKSMLHSQFQQMPQEIQVKLLRFQEQEISQTTNTNISPLHQLISIQQFVLENALISHTLRNNLPEIVLNQMAKLEAMTITT